MAKRYLRAKSDKSCRRKRDLAAIRISAVETARSADLEVSMTDECSTRACYKLTDRERQDDGSD